MEKYSIICHVGPRVVASLSLDGELTIYHDHFTDEEEFELERFIKAFDRWYVRRTVNHNSKRGLNLETLEAINEIQKTKPGQILLSD